MTACVGDDKANSSDNQTATIDSVIGNKSTEDSVVIPETTSHRINEDTAIQLIVNFLNENALRNIAVNYAIGGSFDLNNIYTMNKSRDYLGKAFFICNNINEQNNAYPPTLFCAFQDAGTYTPTSKPEISIQDKITITPNAANIFKYTPSKVDADAVKSFLNASLGYASKDTFTPAGNLTTIKSLANKFLTSFPTSGAKNPYSISPAAFFMKSFVDGKGVNVEIKNFFTQPGINHVRYYFGFRKGDEYKDYRITIILMAVDSNGQNLISDNNYILEKSWPPGGLTDKSN